MTSEITRRAALSLVGAGTTVFLSACAATNVFVGTQEDASSPSASPKDYKGEKFDLQQYVDPNQAFITSKTYMGRPLKALELPGLWNGSMAHWITLFVEVPIITFNPVKVVNDLLKKTHQG